MIRCHCASAFGASGFGNTLATLGGRSFSLGNAAVASAVSMKRQTFRAEAYSPIHFFLPPSSAMYMISCLKMNRLGAPSRVSRTIFLS